MKILGVSREVAETNNKDVLESAMFFWNPIRGGKQVIIAEDGTYLATDSVLNFEELLKEFNDGKRNL